MRPCTLYIHVLLLLLVLVCISIQFYLFAAPLPPQLTFECSPPSVGGGKAPPTVCSDASLTIPSELPLVGLELSLQSAAVLCQDEVESWGLLFSWGNLLEGFSKGFRRSQISDQQLPVKSWALQLIQPSLQFVKVLHVISRLLGESWNYAPAPAFWNQGSDRCLLPVTEPVTKASNKKIDPMRLCSILVNWGITMSSLCWGEGHQPPPPPKMKVIVCEAR